MKLAQITVGLQLSTQLIVGLLVKVGRVFGASSIRRLGPNTVVLVEIYVRIRFTIFNLSQVSYCTAFFSGLDFIIVENAHFEEALGFVHV